MMDKENTTTAENSLDSGQSSPIAIMDPSFQKRKTEWPPRIRFAMILSASFVSTSLIFWIIGITIYYSQATEPVLVDEHMCYRTRSGLVQCLSEPVWGIRNFAAQINKMDEMKKTDLPDPLVDWWVESTRTPHTWQYMAEKLMGVEHRLQYQTTHPADAEQQQQQPQRRFVQKHVDMPEAEPLAPALPPQRPTHIKLPRGDDDDDDTTTTAWETETTTTTATTTRQASLAPRDITETVTITSTTTRAHNEGWEPTTRVTRTKWVKPPKTKRPKTTKWTRGAMPAATDDPKPPNEKPCDITHCPTGCREDDQCNPDCECARLPCPPEGTCDGYCPPGCRDEPPQCICQNGDVFPMLYVYPMRDKATEETPAAATPTPTPAAALEMDAEADKKTKTRTSTLWRTRTRQPKKTKSAAAPSEATVEPEPAERPKKCPRDCKFVPPKMCICPGLAPFQLDTAAAAAHDNDDGASPLQPTAVVATTPELTAPARKRKICPTPCKFIPPMKCVCPPHAPFQLDTADNDDGPSPQQPTAVVATTPELIETPEKPTRCPRPCMIMPPMHCVCPPHAPFQLDTAADDEDDATSPQQPAAVATTPELMESGPKRKKCLKAKCRFVPPKTCVCPPHAPFQLDTTAADDGDDAASPQQLAAAATTAEQMDPPEKRKKCPKNCRFVPPNRCFCVHRAPFQLDTTAADDDDDATSPQQPAAAAATTPEPSAENYCGIFCPERCCVKGVCKDPADCHVTDSQPDDDAATSPAQKQGLAGRRDDAQPEKQQNQPTATAPEPLVTADGDKKKNKDKQPTCPAGCEALHAPVPTETRFPCVPGYEKPPEPLCPYPCVASAPYCFSKPDRLKKRPTPSTAAATTALVPRDGDDSGALDLPPIFGLPYKLGGILKNVLFKFLHIPALPDIIQKIMKLVRLIVDMINKPGDPPVPTLPPPPPPPPPPATTTGMGMRETSSGFVQVTRQSSAIPTPTTTADADDDDVDELAKKKKDKKKKAKKPKLTPVQRDYTNTVTMLLIEDEVRLDRERNPDDPLNEFVTAAGIMALFQDMLKKAERWNRQHPLLPVPKLPDQPNDPPMMGGELWDDWDVEE